MKRRSITAFALATLLLVSANSCGTTEMQTSAVDSETETSPAAETVVNERWLDTVDQSLDFNGAEIGIHCRGEVELEIDVSEQNGNVLNDAVYQRNRAVEERMNIVLKLVPGETWKNYRNSLSQIHASIAAGDNAWQILAGWGKHITVLALENCLYDLNSLDYLDTEQPWWNQSSIEGMNIQNNLHFLVGDLSWYTMLGGSFVVFVNDTLGSQYEIPSISDMVREGTWTIDNMKAITVTLMKDLNGDGIMDENDQWGMVTNLENAADAYYNSADIHQIQIIDGMPKFVPDQERVISLIDKIYPLYYEGETVGSLLFATDGYAMQQKLFVNGQALMMPLCLNAVEGALRDMQDTYTIFPYPKLDETQKSYRTECSNDISLWGIPADNTEPDMAAAVLEVLAAETYQNLTPVYFDICIKDKYARSEETLEMLDIIRNSAYIDVEYAYQTIFGNTNYVVRELMKSKSTNVASWYAKNTNRINAAVEATLDKLEQNANS